MAKLFTDGDSNPKTAKSDNSGQGFLTLLLHLAPAKESGHQVCGSSSVGCRDACLYKQGRGRMNNTQIARIRKTVMWFTDRLTFKSQIIKETTAFVRKCDKVGALPAIRMNGTSDILWEKYFPELFDSFPSVTFYDYTKHVKRCRLSWALPANYHLTFSRSECNNGDCLEVLKDGRHNVAAVFAGKNFPSSLWGYSTYSADEDDLRFLDPPGGHVGALYAKGTAKKDNTGFVLPVV